MSKNVLPMHDIFLACKEVLDTALRPLHYEKLTRRGLEVLGVSESEIDLEKQIEDVREKMLQGRWQKSVFYLGKPYCLGAVTHWFQRGFALEPFVIPTSINIAIRATYEALMRDMMKKNPNASDSSRMMAKAQGCQIEAPVREWFKNSFPANYLPPENDGKYSEWCDHDFRLKVHNTIIKVDISGPDRSGKFGNMGGKRTTDLHLICDITGDGQAVEWLSVVRGCDYIPNLSPEQGISPLQLVVWLNSIKANLPYDLLKKASYGIYNQE